MRFLDARRTAPTRGRAVAGDRRWHLWGRPRQRAPRWNYRWEPPAADWLRAFALVSRRLVRRRLGERLGRRRQWNWIARKPGLGRHHNGRMGDALWDERHLAASHPTVVVVDRNPPLSVTGGRAGGNEFDKICIWDDTSAVIAHRYWWPTVAVAVGMTSLLGVPPAVAGLGRTVVMSEDGAFTAETRRTTTAVQSSESAEWDFFSRLNSARTERGLRSLPMSTAMRGVARSWSAEMVGTCGSTVGKGHNPNLQADVEAVIGNNWSALGENVGCGADVESLDAALLASPPALCQHRRHTLELCGYWRDGRWPRPTVGRL